MFGVMNHYLGTVGIASQATYHPWSDSQRLYQNGRGATALYHPLNPADREIRLMRVLPQNGNTIQCELDIVSLDNAPKFVALSYCWTNDQPSHEILVNGRSLAVRPNLYDYLQLRRSEHSTEWTFIDAICINQGDLKEKSHQVRLMGDVYRDATEVVAWLNEEEDREVDCTPFVREIQELCDKGAKLIQDLDTGSSTNTLVDEEWDLVPLVALSFCNCAYWTRIWVVQELTLARKLTLRTPSLTVDWEVLLRLLEHRFPITTDATGPFHIPDQKPNRANLNEVASGLGTLAMILKSTEENKSLFVTAYYRPMRTTAMLTYKKLFQDVARTGDVAIPMAIPVFASQQCTDLHDKVFGLLGMTRSGLPVNYSAGISELYMQTLIEVLVDMQSNSAPDVPLDIGNVLRVTAALVNALRDGQHFWTMALITTETLIRFGLPVADLFMGFFISEYKLLGYLDNLGTYGKWLRKFLDRSFGSAVVACLALFKTADIHNAVIFKDGGDGKRYQSWVSDINNAYEEALKRHAKKVFNEESREIEI